MKIQFFKVREINGNYVQLAHINKTRVAFKINNLKLYKSIYQKNQKYNLDIEFNENDRLYSIVSKLKDYVINYVYNNQKDSVPNKEFIENQFIDKISQNENTEMYYMPIEVHPECKFFKRNEVDDITEDSYKNLVVGDDIDIVFVFTGIVYGQSKFTIKYTVHKITRHFEEDLDASEYELSDDNCSIIEYNEEKYINKYKNTFTQEEEHENEIVEEIVKDLVEKVVNKQKEEVVVEEEQEEYLEEEPEEEEEELEEEEEEEELEEEEEELEELEELEEELEKELEEEPEEEPEEEQEEQEEQEQEEEVEEELKEEEPEEEPEESGSEIEEPTIIDEPDEYDLVEETPENIIKNFLKDLLHLETIDMKCLEKTEYFKKLMWRNNICIGINKTSFYEKLFLNFINMKNYLNKDFLDVDTFTIYLRRKYRTDITVKKLSGYENDFIIINLEGLWRKFFHNSFTNNHM